MVGGKILGGTYLFLFYLGMLISKYKLLENITLKKSVILSVTGFILWFVWWRFTCHNNYALDSKLLHDSGLNPPGITLWLMAVIMLVLACGIFSLFAHMRYLRWITDFASWIGEHTLYIYLYHEFFLNYFLINHFTIDNIWIKRIVYISVMVFGSILLDYIVHYIAGILSGKSLTVKKD